MIKADGNATSGAGAHSANAADSSTGITANSHNPNQ
jgi:hypothetical protein